MQTHSSTARRPVLSLEVAELVREIDNLAHPWTRSGDEQVRRMANRVCDRAAKLQRLVHEIEELERRACRR